MQILMLGFDPTSLSLQQTDNASSSSLLNLATRRTSVRGDEEDMAVSPSQGSGNDNNNNNNKEEDIAKLRATLRKEVRAEMEKEMILTKLEDTSARSSSSSSVAAAVLVTETPEIANPTTTANSPYAYAYIVGGCNPESPDNYRGFLYNILLSARILRQQGSVADIVAMFQIAYTSEAETLSEDETSWLEALGIHIRYLPKTENESFRHTVLQKFRILDMTEYRRVILMDADVMPIGNLDYMFQLSDGPEAIIKENLIISGPWEPANAGFFMLEPKQGDWDRIQRIMTDQEKDSIVHSDGYFDKVRGWGHVIDNTTDKWVARKENGTLWDFNFAFSDQGLCK